MGKGKRNRQFHFEDKQTNPKKYQEKKKKKQFQMPKWAISTIAIVLLVAIAVGGSLLFFNERGTFLRSRVLVESTTGKFDLNQQMATFILWQNMYQSAYYEYYYISWGIYEDTNKVTSTYSSAAEYGIAMASMYTQYYLREGIEEISSDLVEMVAAADAAVEVYGLKFDKNDEAQVEEYTTWMENVWAAYMSSTNAVQMTYPNFLKEAVADGFTVKDIKDAAKVIIMYNKYCNYVKLELDDDPSNETLQEYIEKNPSGHYEIKYHVYTNASNTFMKKLYEACGKTWDPEADEEETAEEAKELLLSLEIKKFRELVIESILEDDFKGAVMNQIVVDGIANDDKTALDAVIKNNADGIDEKLTELGMETKVYKSNDENLNSAVSEWMFNTSRKANETTLIQSGDKVYLVYISAKATIDETDKKVYNATAGVKEYKYEDFETEEIASYKDLLYKDLDAGEKSNLTLYSYASADKMVEDLFNTISGITADTKLWDNTIVDTEGFVSAETVTAPAADAAPTPIQSTLYAADAAVEAGKIYLIEDAGNACWYLLKVSAIDGETYTVSYATYTGDNAGLVAKDLYNSLVGVSSNASYWDDVLAAEEDFVTDTTISKPDDDEDGDAFQQVLFATSVKLNAGEFYKVHDNGTSYLVKILSVNTDGSCKIAYAIRKDSDYHAIYRSLSATFTTSYKDEATTLTHPETTEKGSADEWLCEGEYKDGDRVFERVENDVAHFEATGSDGKATGKYNVYIVDSPMTQVKKEDMTVYGGYLLYATEKEAEAAKNSLQNKYGFDLWNAFSALYVEKTTTNSSGEESTSQTAATVDTAFVKSDITDTNLQTWLFAADRKVNDLAVIKGTSGYYLAYFVSTEQSWLRTAKDSWVSAETINILETLVKDGGYAINTKNLEKIPASEYTTETTTAATK